MRSALVLAALLSATATRAEPVHVRGAAGKWTTLQGERRGGTLSVRIPPGNTDAGRAVVVLGKPQWMVLDDTAPPLLRALTVGGAPVKVGERAEVHAAGKGPVLQAVIEDAANPLQPASLRVRLAGQTVVGKAKAAPPLARRAEVTLDLTAVGPGAYDAALEAADMAPAANTLRVPLRLVVDGVRRHPDGQAVTVCAGGQEFVLGGGGGVAAGPFLRLGRDGASAYLSTQVGAKFVYARRLVGIEDLPNGGARLIADVIGIDNQDVGQVARLEFDVTFDPDFPGLLLTSRARNLDADGQVYCFWGWLPGASYVSATGEHPWKMAYDTVGKVGWVYLRPSRPDAPGIGMLSPLVFGESRFGTMLLYTDPQRIDTKRGEAVEMKLAFMLTDKPEAVAAACEVLMRKGWLK